MFRTYNYPLHPTAAQARVFESWLGSCQRLYNAALEQRIDAYRKQKILVTLCAQSRELTQLRAADPEYHAVPRSVLSSAISRLDGAYRKFFSQIRSGKKAGFPRFKSMKRYKSFEIKNFRVRCKKLWVPTLGKVKIHLYRPIPKNTRIRCAFIKKHDDRWVLSLVLDIDKPIQIRNEPKTPIGLDLGLTAFVTLSTGETVTNPRFFANEKILADRQQAFSRTKRGSSSRERARKLVAKAHAHISNQRLDFARKLAGSLFSRFDLIAFENLGVHAMARGSLAKSIKDAAWGRFIHCLTLKAEDAGKWAIGVKPHGTTAECSGCGESTPKELREREHICSCCGLVLGRDHNAAINILVRGLRTLEAA